MSVPRTKNFVTTILTACILGFLVCPYIYIVLGSPFQFPLVLNLMILPLFFVGNGFLLWSYFPKPKDHLKSTARGMNVLLVVMEVSSWIAVVVSLFVITMLNLMTSFEQLAFFCFFFLLTSALCLPVVLKRETILERRLLGLPIGLSLGILIVILALSGGVIVAKMLTPTRFIGGPISSSPG